MPTQDGPHPDTYTPVNNSDRLLPAVAVNVLEDVHAGMPATVNYQLLEGQPPPLWYVTIMQGQLRTQAHATTGADIPHPET